MDFDVDKMVLSNMGLAQSLAQQVWKTAPHALDLDELRAIAYLGLVGAANRWLPYCREKEYDPERMEYFKVFVVRRVHGAIMDAIRASDFASRSLRTRAKALQQAGQDKGASHTELAERTGMTVTEVRSTIRGMAQRPVSLEAEELEPNSIQDVESSAFTQTVLTRVVDAMGRLTPELQTVVALHYYRGLQLQQVAKAMGVTETRASQMHAEAVLAIHQAMIDIAQQQETD